MIKARKSVEKSLFLAWRHNVVCAVCVSQLILIGQLDHVSYWGMMLYWPINAEVTFFFLHILVCVCVCVSTSRRSRWTSCPCCVCWRRSCCPWAFRCWTGVGWVRTWGRRRWAAAPCSRTASAAGSCCTSSAGRCSAAPAGGGREQRSQTKKTKKHLKSLKRTKNGHFRQKNVTLNCVFFSNFMSNFCITIFCCCCEVIYSLICYLPAGRFQVDGAPPVGHRALHPHEEIPFGAQLFAFFTEAAACKCATATNTTQHKVSQNFFNFSFHSKFKAWIILITENK